MMNHQLFLQLLQVLKTNPCLQLERAEKILVIDTDSLLSFINLLQQLGLPLKCNDKKELSISEDIEPIQINKINELLAQQSIDSIQILPPLLSIDSTNQYLKNSKEELKDKWRLCLAEHQTAGRGRQGKLWISPMACNIYMSLHCRINIPLKQVGGISLMVGISIVEALSAHGFDDLYIKWPNDIYWKDKKLAGILIESTGLVDNEVELILGIGINVQMPENVSNQINQPWVSLNKISNNKISRNMIIPGVVNCLVKNILRYQENGLSVFMETWRNLDYLYSKEVVVKHSDGKELFGTACGISDLGELMVMNNNQTMNIHAGEVSVRRVEKCNY